MPSARAVLRSLNARLGDSQALAILLLSELSLVAALVFVAIDQDLAAGIALVISALAEYPLERRTKALALIFHQSSLGIPMRFALRILIAVMAMNTSDGRATQVALSCAGIAIVLSLCIRALHNEYRALGPLKPMRTRNIPGQPEISMNPPQHLALIVLAQAATLITAFTVKQWQIILAVGLVAALVLVLTGVPSMKQSWRMRTQKRQTGLTGPLQEVQDFIDSEQPAVIVHLSGPGEAAYQINTWLEALEALDHKVLLVIRNLDLFERVGHTHLPILGLPAASELLMLDFSCARVSLYPANTGDNIHLLRLPELMSAFIGHGDSDKSASNNPFSRVYDELWVAGEAGADRYRNSGLGIDESRYRFVGRPQVDKIVQDPKLGVEEIPTVLYAPTWEGVNPEQEYSSIQAVGHKLISTLVNGGHVRVVYKPHPFTGQRDPHYRAASAAIIDTLNKAKAQSGIDHKVVRGGPITPWFNEATALVSDISSVVSDFLASEKPYAVFDHENIGTKAFRENYPSSAAATIISPTGEGINEFLDVITGSADDELAPYRSKLATYLLGPAEKRTIRAFSESVNELIERSQRERSAYR